MPIAAISGASRGALRSRRYATRSMPQFTRPLKSIAPASASRATPTISAPGRLARHARGSHDGEGEHRAHHEDFAVGEVDQLDDTVDQGVAQRDQRNQARRSRSQ